MDFWFTSWIHLDNFLAEVLDLLWLEETKKVKRGTLKTNNEGRPIRDSRCKNDWKTETDFYETDDRTLEAIYNFVIRDLPNLEKLITRTTSRLMNQLVLNIINFF